MRVSGKGKVMRGGRVSATSWWEFKNARVEHKLQQEEVATYLNVTEGAVSLWEQGKNAPDQKHWLGIEKLLGIPVGEIAMHAANHAARLFLPRNNSDL